MKIDLKNLKPGVTEFWERVEPEELDLPEDEFRMVGALEATHRLRKGGKTLELRVRTTYTLELTCARCLEKFRQRFEEENLYLLQIGSPPPEEEEKPLTTQDILLFFVPVEELDTLPILRETVLLSIPMKPLCKPDCKGLCPVCGANLNREQCGHRPQRVDPRWLKLLELKDKLAG